VDLSISIFSFDPVFDLQIKSNFKDVLNILNYLGRILQVQWLLELLKIRVFEVFDITGFNS